jgi:hypothetical protein
MTIQAQVSVYPQVFVPREYDVFAGLDVDHHSIAATFTDHQRLMQSLRLPYSARQLLNYVRKHFPGQRWIAAHPKVSKEWSRRGRLRRGVALRQIRYEQRRPLIHELVEVPSRLY